ncbi:uncharacterized protein BCR38DRAFT_213068 [Pseudomassariella vexata]|uniref:DUF2293 domain-containing protein n=1 Tax=Pseudomassariella vexata TaxID=1141098 RepID=A0A1Y2DYK6_9PEZI|nr:uncharacterized protein BCR38DRAFT_213068 [Pseudomassariella vexata]ORY64372.1 hypothetical protein BCR38DRAFT_213068 [Pseudomassariella vexata]
MTKEKRKGHLAPIGKTARTRHDKFARAQMHDPRVWRQLNPMKEPPKVKHKSYFEAVENEDKKKKLEYQITSNRSEVGFEFIPTGQPELTRLCKELSREKGCMIFIVSDSKDTTTLDHHMHRHGYHFRQYIVEEARAILKRDGSLEGQAQLDLPGQPGAMSGDQLEINRQADAVLRDLFPRIPNTDRHEIILHAFQMNSTFNGECKVGMAVELPLARRVQLAALAHIRHTHTRYDKLLRETDWANARKAVEKPCLDVIVKWRGDEETGRDQLDEILREVIEISDNEDDSDDESSGGEAAASAAPQHGLPSGNESSEQKASRHTQPAAALVPRRDVPTARPQIGTQKKLSKKERKAAKRARLRFRRYAAVAEDFTSEPNARSPQLDRPSVINVASAMDRTASLHSNHYSGPEYGEPSDMAHLRRMVPGADYPRSPYSNPTRIDLSEQRSRNLPQPSTRSDYAVRGQSPLLIRQGDRNEPKVGYSSDYHHAQRPLSPVRHGQQDMLVPSIEPRSPNGVYNPQSRSLVGTLAPSHALNAPRIISRTIIHEPRGLFGRPQSPGFIVIADENTWDRRRVVAHQPEDYRAYSNAEFIRVGHVSREEDQRFSSFPYPSERPARRPVEASGGWEATTQQPVYYVSDSPYRSREEAHLRTRAHPILMDAPIRDEVPLSTRLNPGFIDTTRRGEAAFRTRTNPVVVDSPRYGDGFIQTRGEPASMNRESISAIRVEAVRGSPGYETHRYSDGRRVFHLEEPAQRVGNPSEYQGEPANGMRHHIPISLEQRTVTQPPQLSSFGRATSSSGYRDRQYDNAQCPQGSGPQPVHMSGNVMIGPAGSRYDVPYGNTRDVYSQTGFLPQPAMGSYNQDENRNVARHMPPGQFAPRVGSQHYSVPQPPFTHEASENSMACHPMQPS